MVTETFHEENFFKIDHFFQSQEIYFKIEKKKKNSKWRKNFEKGEKLFITTKKNNLGCN